MKSMKGTKGMKMGPAPFVWVNAASFPSCSFVPFTSFMHPAFQRLSVGSGFCRVGETRFKGFARAADRPVPSLGLCPRGDTDIRADGLDVHELAQPVAAQLAAVARPLHAAEGEV